MIAAEVKKIEKRFLWFNNIPSDWNLVRIKNICIGKLQYGINIPANKYSDNGVRFLRTTDINEDGEVMSDGIYIPKKEVPENYILQKGDLLFSRSGTVGRCYLHDSDEEYCYAGFLVKFKPNNHLLSKWLYYSSLTKEFKYQIFSEAIESTISNFNGNKYAVLRVAFPKNENELQKIISFLDNKCAEVKKFIQTKQRLIELLKEQRQSIIDEILNPEQKDWNWLRLKNVATVNDETIGEETDDNFILKYIDIGNVNSNGQIEALQEMLFKNAPSRARRIVRNGDVIISTVRTYLKAITLIESEDKNLIASTGFAVLRAKSNIIPEFLNNVLRTSYFINSVTSNSYGVSYPAITATSLARLKISIPPTIEEQTRIVEHIKTETKTLDIAISKAEREIELIKEYREAMIAEAVTGKMKV